MNFKIKEEDRFPERCLTVNLIKNINRKDKGKEVCISSLSSYEKYNLWLDNESKPFSRLTKMGIVRKLLENSKFDKSYVSLVGEKNGT